LLYKKWKAIKKQNNEYKTALQDKRPELQQQDRTGTLGYTYIKQNNNIIELEIRNFSEIRPESVGFLD